MLFEDNLIKDFIDDDRYDEIIKIALFKGYSCFFNINHFFTRIRVSMSLENSEILFCCFQKNHFQQLLHLHLR